MQTGRTPAEYVDPRLPGLAELLETGRQLTPVRPGPPKSHIAGNTRHKSRSPHPSPAGAPAGCSAGVPIGAFRCSSTGGGGPAVASPRNRASAAAAAWRGSGGGVVSPGNQRTPQQQRRSSSTYSSWDMSPSQVGMSASWLVHLGGVSPSCGTDTRFGQAFAVQTVSACCVMIYSQQ